MHNEMSKHLGDQSHGSSRQLHTRTRHAS